MILTVTPNAALDLTWWVDRIEPGATHRVPSGMARAGGKSLNVARVAHQQGAAVLAIATAGGTTGAELDLELRASGLPHELVPVAASTRRSLALYDAGNDETSIFNEFGENHSDAEWLLLLDAVDAALPAAHCLVGSGSLPPASPVPGGGYDSADFYPELVRRAAARGIPSIIDTSGTALLAAADAGATVLKPNRDELIAATGIGDPILAARSLIARGAGLVLLSLGSAGMIAVGAGDEYLSARLPAPLVGNPTGAGDAAVAAVASCFAEAGNGGTDLSSTDLTSTEAIVRRATAWSAAAVLMPLAGEISPLHAELAERLIIERHTIPHATESRS
ncbi:hypothetical protein ASC66_02935 [Leifsonia sp. Root4]|uniref:1-phosphofructokinase family hexose kinase n=1 Tax=Leifsonia sp. Root4 TaxID=1736525 RepID=UPI0006F99AAE|nr:PfkB family carbohydrate kinase [Leifsonia sp. Root4]KQW07928.1 hypothetical protein ASC66_02935 [Leifsonia sp. Root4]